MELSLGLEGQPVRVTVLGTDGEWQCRVNGSIRRTSAEGWSLDLIDPLPALAASTVVALEVLLQGELIWTTTRLQVATSLHATTLRLAVPGALHRGQRRAHPRVDLSLPIHIRRHADGELHPAQLRDLSAGGASFSTEAELALGESVGLVLTLGSGLLFQHVEAVVVRVGSRALLPRTFAVRFSGDERQMALLAEWVSRYQAGEISVEAAR